MSARSHTHPAVAPTEVLDPVCGMTMKAHADDLRAGGQTVMFVAIDGRAAGLTGVADPVKESAAEAIRALHGEGSASSC